MPAWPVEFRVAHGLLRKPLPGDAPALFDGVGGDPAVTRYLGWTTHTDIAQTRQQISYELARWQRDVARTWVLVADGDDAAGGLFQLIGQGHALRLGFAMARRLWGRGLACEALQAVVDLAFDRAGVFRVDAVCDAENRRSSATLIRAGLPFEARLGRYILHPNVSPLPRDVLIHAKVRTS